MYLLYCLSGGDRENGGGGAFQTGNFDPFEKFNLKENL